MSRSDRWPDDYDPDPKSRSPRRGSASLSRRNSGAKKAPVPTTSTTATPKKTRTQDFVVTGRQCLRKSDRANSLPGSHRRPSLESVKSRKPESPRRQATSSSRSHETSLEDDVSLDLSQVSDFEDTNSKYGAKQKSRGVAIATPKDPRSKTRNCSLHQQMEPLAPRNPWTSARRRTLVAGIVSIPLQRVGITGMAARARRWSARLHQPAPCLRKSPQGRRICPATGDNGARAGSGAASGRATAAARGTAATRAAWVSGALLHPRNCAQLYIPIQLFIYLFI
ncbi:hypothetical protein ACJJTC_005300 [Scirpophaga incertulas]